MAKIAVIGSGYVGTTTAAILANCGHSVTAIDIDTQKVAALQSGKAPFFEHGLDSLIAHALKKKMLKASTSYDEATEADFVFSCVGTPDNPDGSSNLSYVYDVATKVAPLLKASAIFVQKSTVPVGTGAQLCTILADARCAYVSNPEFLREGTAIPDTINADRVVAGGSDGQHTIDAVLHLYKSIEKCRKAIASLADVSVEKWRETKYIATTSIESAELIKVSSNAFLAMKISFANSIAKLADHAGADITEVMDAVGADARIGRADLNAGRGYGGGCFPKDVSGLIASATEHGVDMPLMTAATEVNESMPGYIANKIHAMIGDFAGCQIAVLGLAFKAGTSDARRSPGVILANILAKKGAIVRVYDPEANHEAEEDLRKNISVCSSLISAVTDADVVCVTTDWPEFLGYNLRELAAAMRGNIFVDGMNVFDKKAVREAKLTYIGVGR